MNHIDNSLMEHFRSLGFCEVCRRRDRLHPHHLFPRGMDGGKRIDHRWLLIGLCREVYGCHAGYHDHNYPSYERLLEIVSRREKMPVDLIEAFRNAVLLAPKGTDIRSIEHGFEIERQSRERLRGAYTLGEAIPF